MIFFSFRSLRNFFFTPRWWSSLRKAFRDEMISTCCPCGNVPPVLSSPFGKKEESRLPLSRPISLPLNFVFPPYPVAGASRFFCSSRSQFSSRRSPFATPRRRTGFCLSSPLAACFSLRFLGSCTFGLTFLPFGYQMSPPFSARV